MGSFERLLGSSLLECLKAFLVCWHVVLPIFNGSVRLIFLEVIALATCMGSWALVALIIPSRF
jgi:hypothetical protein